MTKKEGGILCESKNIKNGKTCSIWIGMKIMKRRMIFQKSKKNAIPLSMV
jgi:hypothetical protein